MPIRRTHAVQLGALRDRRTVGGERLVTASDHLGTATFIAAAAVWTDGEDERHPQRPQAIGLATAGTPHEAVLAGLSDRLGWEALLALEAGADLPSADDLAGAVGEHVLVLDGRLDHDVPTVVVLGRDTLRWGAAATWEGALRRALFGRIDLPDVTAELDRLVTGLAAGGLAVVSVDLGTPGLEAAGIARRSVQLVVR